MSTNQFPVSSLARRVAANWLKERGKIALEKMPADGGGGDQTAIPKSGPGKAIMMKQLDQLKGALEKGDHDAFDRGLANLNSLFQKSTHVKAT
jgi:hypothetical protein